jgi:hypothetical protein
MRVVRLITNRGNKASEFPRFVKLEEKEKDLNFMKLTILKALLIPIALLSLGGINQASAGTCATTSYTMTAVTTGSFSCTIGNLTFSNFDYVYEAGIDTGCGASCTAPSDPNPSTGVTVNFAETTSGSDPFGTAASVGSPIISVITDYSAGNTVSEFQNETGAVQYLVTVTGGSKVTEVDGAITGAASNSASGDLNKDVCANNQFGGGPNPNGNCPSFNTNETIVASDLALVSKAGTQADGTPDWARPLSLTTLGVYDGWSLDGGTTHTSATANLTSVENDFIDPSSPAPEPGTIVLLGSALVGLGLIRRRRKVR